MCDCAEELERRCKAEKERIAKEREAAIQAAKVLLQAEATQAAEAAKAAQEARAAKAEQARRAKEAKPAQAGQIKRGRASASGSPENNCNTSWVVGGTLLMASLLGLLAKTGSNPDGWAKPLHSYFNVVGKGVCSGFTAAALAEAADDECECDDDEDDDQSKCGVKIKDEKRKHCF